MPTLAPNMGDILEDTPAEEAELRAVYFGDGAAVAAVAPVVPRPLLYHPWFQ